MKLVTRGVLVVVLLAALMVPLSAAAQEEMPCFGLSAGDCALMYSANMDEVTSFTQNYTLTLFVTDAVDFSSDGGGNFSKFPLVKEPLKSFAMDMILNGSMSDLTTGVTEAGSMEFRIIDGMFYLFAEGEGWLGLKIEDAVQVLAEEGDFEAMGIDLEGLLSGEIEEMAVPEEEFDVTALNALIMPYVTALRGADITVGGNAVAVFTTTFDLGAMLTALGQDPTAFNEVLNEMISAAAEAGALDQADMTEEDLQMVTAFLPMLGFFFSDATVSVTQHVGVVDNYLYGFGLNLDITIDPMMAASMMGEAADPEAEPVDIRLSFLVELTNHNQTFTYTAPETYTEITEDMMRSGMDFGDF